MVSSIKQIGNYHTYEMEYYNIHDFINRPADTCVILKESDEIFIGKKAIASQTCCGAALRFITIPSNIEYIGQSAFSCCEDLVEFEAKEGLQIIGRYAFSDCYELKKISLPSSLTVLGKHAFKKCYQLQEIVIPPRVEILPPVEESPFVCCPRLENIECNVCLRDRMIEYSAFLPSLKKIVLTDKEGNKVATMRRVESKVASDNLGSKKKFAEIYEAEMSVDRQSGDDEGITI